MTQPNVHLVSLVGGFVGALPHMLRHYRDLGVSSLMVNLHKRWPDDPVGPEIEAVLDDFGCSVWNTYTGDLYEFQERSLRETMSARPDDWFVVADQDELHRYPDDLLDLIAWCDKAGYDHVRGCFVDRLAEDGRLKPMEHGTSLWDQYPIGGMISYPISNADPRKIVAAKGTVRLARGQHHALSGRSCPIRDAFVQVHHFKWVSGLYEYLQQRMERLKAASRPHWVESASMLAYLDAHDHRFDLSDPRFMACRCSMSYEYWPQVIDIFENHELNIIT